MTEADPTTLLPDLPARLATPYPERGAADELHQRLVRALQAAEGAGAGGRFLSDAELVRLSGLSRPTVRRALDALQREGWIVREIGRGTFLGPRLGAGLPPPLAAPRSLTRIALSVFHAGSPRLDWYSAGILEGLDAEAHAQGVATEVLGASSADADELLARLRRSRPDLLVCCVLDDLTVRLLHEAERLGIGRVVAGHAGPVRPPACYLREDNDQAVALAVAGLVERGHRRIAFVAHRYGADWVFERHAAFERALAAHGIEPDPRLIHWMPYQRAGGVGDHAGLLRFVERERPTGLVAAAWPVTAAIGRLVAAGSLALPERLSVIGIDRRDDLIELFGLRPSCIELPLVAIGRHIACHARELAAGRADGDEHRFPARLIDGATLGPPAPA